MACKPLESFPERVAVIESTLRGQPFKTPVKGLALPDQYDGVTDPVQIHKICKAHRVFLVDKCRYSACRNLPA